MKGYDSINRYCGRLEMRLNKTENKESIVAEVKQHLIEHSDALIKNGCPPEAAELMAIEDMGPVNRLSSNLLKYNKRLENKTVSERGWLEDYFFDLNVRFDLIKLNQNHLSAIKWHELFSLFLIYAFIGFIWIYLKLICARNDLLITAYTASLLAVIAYACKIKCEDKYKPFFTKRNIIGLVILLMVVPPFHKIFEIFLVYGLIFFLSNTISFESGYMIFRTVISFAFTILTVLRLKKKRDRKLFIVLSIISMILSLFFQPAFIILSDKTALGLSLCIIGIFTAAAGVYTTLYCSDKYWVRTLIFCFACVSLAEIFYQLIIVGLIG